MSNSGFTSRVLAAAGLLFVCAGLLHASSSQMDKELQIKAAFLLNFVKFTAWPAEAFTGNRADFVIAIVGDDPFGQVLDQTFAREQVQGRKISIKRLKLPSPHDYPSSLAYESAIEEFRGRLQTAHLAYFSNCDSRELTLALQSVDRTYLLTVGDERRCAEHSTALALDRDGDRIIFYANTHELESLKLQVSSRLLSLARVIDDRRASRHGGTR